MNPNVDASTMRRINRATVLRLIRDKRTTTRIDIAQITGLNKATVSHIVDELLEDQFVVEIGYGSSSGGRKPVLLRFNANAAYAVGVDVQISQLTTVVCNIRGESVYRNTITPDLASSSENFQQSLQRALVHQIQLALDSVPKSPYGLVGIGLGIPGMVDFERGVIYHLHDITSTAWELANELRAKFSVPVYCDNDANCGAWNEYAGRISRPRTFVYISAGVGIGAGIIIEGKLFRGHAGIAGEFGHMTIDPMGASCQCGSYGCWEEYASDRGLLRHLRQAGDNLTSYDLARPLLLQVLEQAQRDNRASIWALHTLGQYLGIGISNILNALNPEELVIGGSIAGAAAFVLPEVERTLQHRALLTNKTVPIRIANVNSVAVGAATLAIEEVLFAPSSIV